MTPLPIERLDELEAWLESGKVLDVCLTDSELLTIINMARSAVWQPIETAQIDDTAEYLVLTNGGEWRDAGLLVRPGVAVRHMLRPNIVRGRPQFIIKIVRPSPPEPSS